MKVLNQLLLPVAVVFVFFSPVQQVQAATYYVCGNAAECNSHGNSGWPTGSDSNSGLSKSAPLRTIQKAVNLAQPGDFIKVKPGRYYERIVIARSGTAAAPIVLEGETGTIVNGSDATSGWVPAPEIGAGVYKTAAIPYNPYAMTADDSRELIRIHDDNMKSNKWVNWKGLITPPANATYEATCTDAKLPFVTVNYWDGHEAFYGYLDGTTYIRFRNGDSPASRNVRSSPGPKNCFSCWPQGAAFLLTDKSYLHIKGFTIQGAQWAVAMKGSNAGHNLIEGNHMMNGFGRVYIGPGPDSNLRAGSHNNIIRNNTMERRALGFDQFPPRAAGRSANCDPAQHPDPYALGVTGRYYRTYKFIIGNSNEANADVGVKLFYAGANNQIVGNTIKNGAVGLDVARARGVRISDNTIHNMGCQGIFIQEEALDLHINDNLIYDMNIHIRPQNMQLGSRRVYIYRNRFYNPRFTGAAHFYFHFWPNSTPPSSYPEVFVYHNTFVGGYIAFGIGDALPAKGLQGTRFINNVFSTHQFYTPWVASAFVTDADMVDLFDYNWVGGIYARGQPAWFGAKNINAAQQQLWDAGALPDFNLPANSAARGAGIDVSKSFTLNGKTYGPLPGFSPGYFRGGRPDLGAIQSDPSGTPRAPTGLQID